MPQAELFSAREVARILELTESRVLYWARTGVVGPSVRRGGRMLFTFPDLIGVKAAKELLDRGLSLQAVRKNLAALRTALPDVHRPLAQLRVVSDGERVVVAGADAPFEPLSGQLVMDFTVSSLTREAQRVQPLHPEAPRPAPPPDEPESAYGWFREGCARDADDPRAAEHALRRALALDPHLAAAHTNLGRLAHGAGRVDDARRAFEQALALDPEQPEARFNLANLLDELGEAGLAAAEWARVIDLAPAFADAHFNLGAARARDGDPASARAHLERYLALDAQGEWADEARRLLAALSAG